MLETYLICFVKEQVFASTDMLCAHKTLLLEIHGRAASSPIVSIVLYTKCLVKNVIQVIPFFPQEQMKSYLYLSLLFMCLAPQP